MLAQSFKSAAELEITEPQRDALQKVLTLLETEQLQHVSFDSLDYAGSMELQDLRFDGLFNMHTWHSGHTCGTAACIAGTAELISGKGLFSGANSDALDDLFQPRMIDSDDWRDITPSHAARALRSYLTSGDAKWLEAIQPA